MKKLITLIFLLQVGMAFGQATAYIDFKVAEQELIFQKIFIADSITVAKLEEFYKGLPYISNLESTTDGLQFDLNDITVDYKKFQYSQVNTPIMIQTGKFSGKVSVGVKDGKYRITIKAIQLTGNMGYKMITEKDNLTRYATKNNGTILSQDWCKPNMFGLLNKAIIDKLELKKTDSDW